MLEGITKDLRLASFANAGIRQTTMSVAIWIDQLLKPEREGFLIYGGAGSGKTAALEYLRQEINEDEEFGYVLGPFDMGFHEGETLFNNVLADLVTKILDTAAAHPAGPPITRLPDATLNFSPERLAGYVSHALATLSQTGTGRVVLLLDNYDKIPLLVAVRLARHLRAWFDEHKRYFTFVLTAETDLEDLRAGSSVYSPLQNVCTEHLLLGLTEQQTRHLAAQRAAQQGISLTESDQATLWQQTLGSPPLVEALLDTTAQVRKTNSHYTIDDAVAHCLDQYTRFEPLHTATRHIRDLANLDAHGFNPAAVLNGLVHGRLPDAQSRAARLLRIMGTLNWQGENTLTWANPFVQRFFEKSRVGQQMIANWMNRPLSFQEGQLSAQGTVFVSLFIDIAPWLTPMGENSFDEVRGTLDWRKRLREIPSLLPATSDFAYWSAQKKLINLGHDLNLFREQAHQSFMPVYEARVEKLEIDWERQLQRFDESTLNGKPDDRQKAMEVLRQEWQRWDRVRVQFTSDGAAHVVLLRNILEPLPLMQILDELLGLERELLGRDGRLRDLSVQWEIALAILTAFFHQVGKEAQEYLGFVWNEPRVTTMASESLYPLRDRYVVLTLRKLCNCRTGGLRPPKERKLITVEQDLTPLLPSQNGGLAPGSPRYDETYNYGKELACLLEGVMIRKPGVADQSPRLDENSTPEQPILEVGEFPKLKPREIYDMLNADLSSWENELFVASLDNALVVYQTVEKVKDGGESKAEANVDDSPDGVSEGEKSPSRNHDQQPAKKPPDAFCRVCQDWERHQIENLYFPQRTVAYEDYWECMVMGLQYVIELRWATQWIVRQTTRDLGKLADLMELSVEDRDADAVAKLGSRLAMTTRLLSHLRDASIPMYIAGTDFAARKYERIIEVSGLRAKIESAEKNIAAINAFLDHHEDQRSQEAFNRVGVFLAIFAIFVALPSLWVDFGGNLDTSVWHYIGTFVSFFFPTLRWRDGIPLPFLLVVTAIILWIATPYLQLPTMWRRASEWVRDLVARIRRR